jgi:hypothetical protein
MENQMATRKTAAKPTIATRRSIAARSSTVAKKEAPARGKTYLPGTAIPADLKPVKRVAKKAAVTDDQIGVATKEGIMSKAEAKLAVTSTGRSAGKAVPTAKVKAVAKATDVKFRGFVIPAGRKPNDGDEGIPTIELRKVSDVSKLFAVLPKGAYIDSFNSRTINVYNRAGMLIVELSTYSAS